mgnify:CR=1 FL=1|tara:strand:- start:5867 stop:6361 length:495 start_codon:yes stop_codon:yes gene_type:complete
MEPISTLLSSYLLSFSSHIQSNYRELTNLDITPLSIDYKNELISYQHQLWIIKKESVCNTYRQDPIRFSTCTVKAKSLFTEICSELSKKKSPSHITAKHKSMYCNASLSYKPMIATISSPSRSKLSENEKACNKLILQTMGSKDENLIAKREKTCQFNQNKGNN